MCIYVQAAQCVGRVIRSKRDFALMIFADARFSRPDKRNKLPPWITRYLDQTNLALNTETAVRYTEHPHTYTLSIYYIYDIYIIYIIYIIYNILYTIYTIRIYCI